MYIDVLYLQYSRDGPHGHESLRLCSYGDKMRYKLLCIGIQFDDQGSIMHGRTMLTYYN